MTPAAAAEHVASYEVTVDGQTLAREHLDRIKEIRIADQLRLPDLCTVLITYPRGDGIDRMPFALGTPLTVSLGARTTLVPRPLFTGVVTTVEPEFGAGGCAVTVRAFDGSHVLHRARKVRTFQNQTASDIVEAIVGEAGIPVEVEASGEPYTFVQQDNETDWDFVWRLADRAGFEFVHRDGKASFRRPAPDEQLELTWPGALRTFRPRVTAVQQVQKVTVAAWHPATGDALSSEAHAPTRPADIGVRREALADAFGEAEVHVASEPVESAAHGEQLAQALLDRLADAFLTADGVAVGDPRIRSGAQVEVKGIGERFGGHYRVAGATHVLRGGGAYETHFTNVAGRTILGATGGGGSGAPRFGSELVVGLVTQNEDPEGMARVRVSYPALGPDVEGAWAHVITPHAGEGRGLLMLPVAGDEVLVGFEHGDTARPMVLGSVFNGSATPGELVADHDGSLVVHSDGQVTLTSEKETAIHAGADLTLDAQAALAAKVAQGASVDVQQGLDVSAQTVSITGQMNVELSATGTLKLSCGASSIELSPAGVKVSGPMVTLG